MKPASVSVYLNVGCGRCPLGNTPQCKVHSWSEELLLLRSIMLDSPLTEEVKWGIPCYTFKGKNILTFSALKNECVIGFLKGALIQDKHGLLKPPGPNAHESRVLRFTHTDQICDGKNIIHEYIQEAIKIEESGRKVEPKLISDMAFPEELIHVLKEDVQYKKSFELLSPGKQKGYLFYFSSPKKSETRMSRIEKYRDRILSGKGLHDY